MSARRTRPLRLSALVCALLLWGCANTRLHNDGMRMMAAGQEDEGLRLLQEAAKQEPNNAEYRIDMLKQSDLYTDKLLLQADEARQSGDIAIAQALYARILKMRPSSAQARRGLAGIELDARTARLVADSERLQRDGHSDLARDKARAAMVVNPSHPGAKAQLASLAEQEEKANDARLEKIASLFVAMVMASFRRDDAAWTCLKLAPL